MNDPLKEILELQIVVWGRVQGVGFRVTARRYALQLKLDGSVQNLEDGNVEIFVQGPRDKLEEFVRLLKAHYSSGYIARMDMHFEKPMQSFESFQII
jgi:acylphosphatase